MRGIILAGGTGSRLYPLTKAVNKQLLPVYDKPMIYYPLSLLMKAGIQDILIIVNSERSQEAFFDLLEDGSQLDINIKYKVQEKPNGIAEAFIIAEEFIGNDSVMLALGDNIFYSYILDKFLNEINNIEYKNVIFGCQVKTPFDYGIAVTKPKINKYFEVINLVEKPSKPPTNWAVPGLYMFDNTVVEKAKRLRPSSRGELEITDLGQSYIDEDHSLTLVKLYDAFWFDCGNCDRLLEASQFVNAIQNRIGMPIGDPFVIATGK